MNNAQDYSTERRQSIKQVSHSHEGKSSYDGLNLSNFDDKRKKIKKYSEFEDVGDKIVESDVADESAIVVAKSAEIELLLDGTDENIMTRSSATIQGVRGVVCLELSSGMALRYFPSLVTASQFIRGSHNFASGIMRCCKGEALSAVGFGWRRAEEGEETLVDMDLEELLTFQDGGSARFRGGVVCFDLNSGESLRYFASLAGASAFVRGSESLVSVISDCCKGKASSAAGFGWRRAKDADKDNIEMDLAELSTHQVPQSTQSRRPDMLGVMSVVIEDNKVAAGYFSRGGDDPRDCKAGSCAVSGGPDVATGITRMRRISGVDLNSLTHFKTNSTENVAAGVGDRNPSNHDSVLKTETLECVAEEDISVAQSSASASASANTDKKTRGVVCVQVRSGKALRFFPSLVAASQFIRGSNNFASGIMRCCKGEASSAAGFGWRRAEEGEETLVEMDFEELLSYQDGGATNFRGGVVCFDLDSGKSLRYFASIASASLFIRGSKSSVSVISDCCKGKVASVAGFGWRYSEEGEQALEEVDLERPQSHNVQRLSGSSSMDVSSGEGEALVDESSLLNGASSSVVIGIDKAAADRGVHSTGVYGDGLTSLRGQSRNKTVRISAGFTHSHGDGICDDEVDENETVYPRQSSEAGPLQGVSGEDDLLTASSSRRLPGVVCLHPSSGKALRYFQSLAVASQFFRGSNNFMSGINRCCKGKATSAVGLGWRYAEHGDEEALALADMELPELLSHQEEGSTRHRRGVVCLHLSSGKALRYFPSISDALRFMHKPMSTSNITVCCKGERETAHGFGWRYSEDGDEALVDMGLTELMTYQDDSTLYRRGVVCLHLGSGKALRYFPSISDALRFMHKPMSTSNITVCCKGEGTSAYGFGWRYAEHGEEDLVDISLAELLTYMALSGIDKADRDYGDDNYVDDGTACPHQSGEAGRPQGVSGEDDLTAEPLASSSRRPQGVVCLHPVSGKALRYFSSLAGASQFLRGSSSFVSGIMKCCKGERESAVGFGWRYAEDGEDGLEDMTLPELLTHMLSRRRGGVVCFDVASGQALRYFSSASDASMYLRNNKSLGGAISDCCKGERESTHGFGWRNAEEGEETLVDMDLSQLLFFQDEKLNLSRRGVVCLQLGSGEALRYFASLSAASLFIQGGRALVGVIGDCCKGKSSSAAGFGWRFAAAGEEGLESLGAMGVNYRRMGLAELLTRRAQGVNYRRQEEEMFVTDLDNGDASFDSFSAAAATAGFDAFHDGDGDSYRDMDDSAVDKAEEFLRKYYALGAQTIDLTFTAEVGELYQDPWQGEEDSDMRLKVEIRLRSLISQLHAAATALKSTDTDTVAPSAFLQHLLECRDHEKCSLVQCRSLCAVLSHVADCTSSGCDFCSVTVGDVVQRTKELHNMLGLGSGLGSGLDLGCELSPQSKQEQQQQEESPQCCQLIVKQWHASVNLFDRERIMDDILVTLSEHVSKLEASLKPSREQLVEAIPRLEEQLFHQADSRTEYEDAATLPARLRLIPHVQASQQESSSMESEMQCWLQHEQPLLPQQQEHQEQKQEQQEQQQQQEEQEQQHALLALSECNGPVSEPSVDPPPLLSLPSRADDALRLRRSLMWIGSSGALEPLDLCEEAVAIMQAAQSYSNKALNRGISGGCSEGAVDKWGPGRGLRISTGMGLRRGSGKGPGKRRESKSENKSEKSSDGKIESRPERGAGRRPDSKPESRLDNGAARTLDKGSKRGSEARSEKTRESKPDRGAARGPEFGAEKGSERRAGKRRGDRLQKGEKRPGRRSEGEQKSRVQSSPTAVGSSEQPPVAADEISAASMKPKTMQSKRLLPASEEVSSRASASDRKRSKGSDGGNAASTTGPQDPPPPPPPLALPSRPRRLRGGY